MHTRFLSIVVVLSASVPVGACNNPLHPAQLHPAEPNEPVPERDICSDLVDNPSPQNATPGDAGSEHGVAADVTAQDASRGDITPWYCSSGDCGPNSPIVNAFPYNGLHPDGCKNRDGVGLEKASLVTERCPAAGKDTLYLDVTPFDLRVGYQLVGKDEHDQVRCRGTELVGATFKVVQDHHEQTLRISQMGKVDVEQPEMTASNSASTTRTVYLITPDDQPANSLCTSLAPGATARPTPVLDTRSGQLSYVEDEELAAYAIIIPGAVYDFSGMLIERSLETTRAKAPGAAPHRWFNIACATDGLAQTELSGLATAPITGKTTARARLPALHMFTAKYCGGISATSRGTPIRWSTRGIFSKRPSRALGPVEAEWNEDGATCLLHSRLWIPNKAISLPPQLADLAEFANVSSMKERDFLQRLQDTCKHPILRCDESSRSDVLTSYTMNHDRDKDEGSGNQHATR